MAQTDIIVTHFSDDKNRDGSKNVGLLIVQLPDVAASLRKFY
jgi:hypothetical protein